MTDDPLPGCQLKLQQAQRHLWELKAPRSAHVIARKAQEVTEPV